MTEEQREDENSVGMLYTKGVTMFEKEAEEWWNNEYFPSLYDNVSEVWQDGAEFGYKEGIKTLDDMTRAFNREHKKYTDLRIATEWHKQEVDDIYDLISEDWIVRHFICIMKDKSRVTAIGNCDESCNGEVSVNLFFEHNDEKYCLDDIVWWKEIVLPKESE